MHAEENCWAITEAAVWSLNFSVLEFGFQLDVLVHSPAISSVPSIL